MAKNNSLLSVQEALNKIKETVQPVQETEIVQLAHSLNRILSEDTFSPIPLPPFKSSAMDGFALKRSNWTSSRDKIFSIIGQSLAGHPFQGTTQNNDCIRIFTGAKIPDEYDLIILQEQVDYIDRTRVCFLDHHPDETYVRPVGHDRNLGSVICRQGQRINPIILSTLSASGIAKIRVFRKPTVGVFSSGDELVSADTKHENLKDGQIFESNRQFLLSALKNLDLNLIDYGNIPDTKEITTQSLSKAAKECDLVITSGGVSVGDADFITTTIKEIGSLGFWRLNLKPGKPLAFGEIDNCKVLGLPGNPVSTIITTMLIANPLIDHMSGALPKNPLKIKATCKATINHSVGRTEYQRAKFFNDENGSFFVEQLEDQSSNRLSSFTDSNCLLEIPDTKGNISAGEEVTIFPLVDTGLVGRQIR